MTSEYVNYQVIVCENGGGAAFQQLATALAAPEYATLDLTLFDAGGNLGYAGGVNACLKRAPDADAWWIINPDTTPGPELLASLVRDFEQGAADALGCTLLYSSGRVQSRGGRWSPLFARAQSIGMGGDINDRVDRTKIEAQQNYLNGASMFVSRRFVSEAGYMREDYFLYCEEVEWCLRAERLGLKLGYSDGPGLIHAQGTTTGAGGMAIGRSRLSIHLGERNKLLVTRDLYPAALPFAICATLVQLAVRYGKARAFREFGYALRGWMGGILNERGCPDWLIP